MSEFEDKINAVLNDPGQMEKITQMAAQLMGGGSAGPAAEPEPSGGAFDPEILSKIGKLMFKADQGSNDKIALLKAMGPYLAPERREKMEKAVKFAHIAKIASVALKEYGGGSHV